MNTFPQRIKELRIANNLTQKEVANFIGMSLMAYAHYELGDRQPSLDTVNKLCDLFTVTSDYLLGRTDNY